MLTALTRYPGQRAALLAYGAVQLFLNEVPRAQGVAASPSDSLASRYRARMVLGIVHTLVHPDTPPSSVFWLRGGKEGVNCAPSRLCPLSEKADSLQFVSLCSEFPCTRFSGSLVSDMRALPLHLCAPLFLSSVGSVGTREEASSPVSLRPSGRPPAPMRSVAASYAVRVWGID